MLASKGDTDAEHKSSKQSPHRPTACTLLPRALAPEKRLMLSRSKNHEEAKGFLAYRIADRRGDHSDHRGYRYSELAALEDRSERIIRSGLGSYYQHGGSDVSVQLGQRFRCRFDESRRSLPLRRRDFGHCLLNRPAFERCSEHEERVCVQRRRHSPREWRT